MMVFSSFPDFRNAGCEGYGNLAIAAPAEPSIEEEEVEEVDLEAAPGSASSASGSVRFDDDEDVGAVEIPGECSLLHLAKSSSETAFSVVSSLSD